MNKYVYTNREQRKYNMGKERSTVLRVFFTFIATQSGVHKKD